MKPFNSLLMNLMLLYDLNAKYTKLKVSYQKERKLIFIITKLFFALKKIILGVILPVYLLTTTITLREAIYLR